MFSKFEKSWWLWTAAILTVCKIWLTRGQAVVAIGPAIHDDRLFLELAAHLVRGEWLGPYDQLTLAKGPFYSLWVAAVYLVGLPLRFAEQLAYAGACALVVRALRPLLTADFIRLAVYSLLWWNPMSFEGRNLTRIVRQNIYTPLALVVFAALIALCLRRTRPFRELLPWALILGLAFGAFWLTREESVWLVPGVAILGVTLFLGLPREPALWRRLAAILAIAVAAAALPLLTVSALNLRYYGWFGTVEFRASEFKDAYGALARIRTGPTLPGVPVMRQAREAAYAVSPAFAELQPYLDGPIGDKWAEQELFPAAERQIRGGWFMWALRDSVSAAGHGRSAGDAMEYYRRLATEINRACDDGRLPAGARRSGFLPEWYAGLGPKLWFGALEFADYFGGFRAFTANLAESVGNDESLELFRDLTREQLSSSPEATNFELPQQSARDRDKRERLNQIGGLVLNLLVALVLAAHVVWPVRLVQALVRRHFPLPLLFATAAWAACAAYLAINVIIHVMSFPNLTPSAMAAAYPLLILFVIAVALDAFTAWSKPSTAKATDSTTAPQPSRLVAWLWAGGAALLVFAARLHEIHLYTGAVPFNDQWKIEAADIIGPWLDGTFSPTAFFIPHYEHLPVWTRMLAWAEVVLTGRWDPLVQVTVNAALYASFVALVVHWLRRSLGLLAAVGGTLLVISCGAWPHAWENITWGFQSQFPLAILFLFLHVRGSFEHEPGARGWWLAQAAGVAGLFTLASMWIAPLAVVAVSLWTKPRGRLVRFAPLLIAAAGLLILALIRAQAPPGGAFAQNVQSLAAFFQAWLLQLGWPSGWPGATVLLNLPLLLLALQLRGRTEATSFDRIVLALGVWSATQAAALAFARGGDFSGFVSRYGELLAVGVLANGFALLRLLAASAGTWRNAAWTLLLCWVCVVGYGISTLATTGHSRYFHDHAAEWADLRRAAVQSYLATGDILRLASPEVTQALYGDFATVARLLDRPAFRAGLTNSVNPASPADLPGRFVRFVQLHWTWLALGGGVILAAGISLSPRRVGDHEAASLELRSDLLPLWLVAAVGAGAFALLLQWPQLTEFDQGRRWQQLISPRSAVTGLSFEFVGQAEFPNDRLIGAADLHPENLRDCFRGTRPNGPAFTGVARSTVFRIDVPWLVVPFAGYPVSDGNALRLQVEDETGKVLAQLVCPGPAPREIGFWPVDVRAYQGRSTRLVLYDGRAGAEGWVATAPPIRARSAEQAQKLRHRLELEHVSGSRPTLAWLALLCAAWVATEGLLALRRRKKNPPTSAVASTA